MAATFIQKSVVKQVLSGDCIVVRGRPQGGPPPERTIALSNLTAPRLSRKADTQDELFAWESREFLRTRLAGREVLFTVDGKNPQGKEYGTVYLPSATGAPPRAFSSAQELAESSDVENVNEAIVKAGLVEVRRLTSGAALASAGDAYRRLVELEDAAKAAKKGKWCDNPSQAPLAVRNVEWSLANPMHFVDSMKARPQSAVVEHVRDGCTFRVLLLPEEGSDRPVFYNFTFILSGLRTPTFKLENEEQVPEEFAEEARFFVESRILQRQVTLQLESVSGQSIVGSMLHPKGNIALLLLQEGMARCVNWSINIVSAPGGAEAMRQAERQAKEKRLRLWQNWQAPAGLSAADIVGNAGGAGANSNGSTAPQVAHAPVTGRVIEVGNGDSLVVKRSDGQQQRYFLASVRPPRQTAGAAPTAPAAPPSTKFRPLYDIPYMFEAREFLRKKLVGKKVTVLIDYVQQPLQTGPQEERICATVLLGEDTNVAEALVAKGLATVVKYRPDEERRSRAYDLLLAAEAVAQKKMVGLHSKKDAPTHRVADLMGDVNKARQFLPFLKRGGRLEGIVEYVASGSRLRVYIPKETCIITLLCAGLECPRPPRRLPTGKDDPGDPKGQEAMDLTREQVLQREVEFEVESMDKGGNFVGWLFYCNSGAAADNVNVVGSGVQNAPTCNLSVALVEAGLAQVHFTAERSPYFAALSQAEQKANAARVGLWSLDPSQQSRLRKPDAAANEAQQGKSKSLAKKSKGTLVAVKQDGLRFYAQLSENSSALQRVTGEVHKHTEEHPPISGAYTPRTGEICLAQSSQDTLWYRARVLKVLAGGKEARVLLVDYGNEEHVKPVSARMATLPPSLGLSCVPAQAKEFRLAGVQLPPEEEDKKVVWETIENDLILKEVELNPEYEDAVSVSLLQSAEAGEAVDVAEILLQQGLICMEKTRELRQELRSRYEAAQLEAKKQRRHIWCYGDFTEDE